MDDQQMPGMPERKDALKSVENTMDQARTAARDAGDQVWSAAATAGATAQDLARRAREQTDTLYQQASAASETLLQQGTRAGEYLTRNVNEYPLTALLLAGAIGYSMAYLIHSRWQADPGTRSFG